MKTVVWKLAEVTIVKHWDSWYSLQWNGEEVISGTFDCVTRYFWAEFADL